MKKPTLLMILLPLAVFAYALSSHAGAAERSKEIEITGKFLIYPVGERAGEKETPALELLEQGADSATAKPLRKWPAPLAGSRIIDWRFSDVAVLRGRKLTLRVSNYSDERGGWDRIYQSDEFMPKGFTDEGGMRFYQIYTEPGRPQFHFTAMRGWLNDPNGLVYANGQYHLFYQYDPVDAPKSWGHAVSDDLVHWKELPVAIRPEPGTRAYSGSAIVDRDNVTGLKSKDNKGDLILANFTHCDHTPMIECLAYSNDNGLTFQHGPVSETGLRHPPGSGGRDPKVIWHEPTKKWVAAIWDWGRKPQGEPPEGSGIVFYSSKDLLNWDFESRLKCDLYECPELFELACDGDPAKRKWILQDASSRYFIGAFDGREFKSDHAKDGLPTGFMQSLSGTFYAAQTWNDIPKSDGRRIQIAWGRTGGNKYWEQQLLFPCELSLRTTKDGPRLFTNPVREISKLRKDKIYRWENVKFEKGKKASFDADEELLDLTLVLKPSADAAVHMNLHGAGQRLGLADKGESPLASRNGRITVRMLLDQGTLETYAFDGEVYIPAGCGTSPANKELSFTLLAGECEIESLEVHGLKSAWGKQ